jgi:hypothetical protein
MSRRFNEAEVDAIFKRATEVQQARQKQLSSGDGMTLAELEEIGREVGIAPELVRQAAMSVQQTASISSRRFLGIPVGVGRTVDLGRQLTEREWERLVIDLRETFDAKGTVKQEGSFRQWTNGNLQALVEPTPSGHRVRLRTMKATALSWMSGGVAISGLGGALAVATSFDPAGTPGIGVALQLAVAGAAMFGFGALQLPGWMRLRRKQMEQVAERLALPTEDDSEGSA